MTSSFSLDDTIAAISTPVGHGAIGIVRLSGPDSRAIAERLFVGSHDSHPTDDGQPSHHLTLGWVIDPASGERIDQVLLAVMRAPNSYTGQDVVEFQAHGGGVVLQEILRLTLDAGARLAEPGEFTLRAFVNGRMDLAQAEAVMDVISARTGAALRVATRQLDGGLSSQIRAVRTILVGVLAYCEARLDFVDDEIPEEDVAKSLSEALAALTTLLNEAGRGMIYRQGVRTVIVGRPNVGKSSLLNRLLRQDRAIVTAVPGTTRDTLEETINLSGVPFVLADTAGINDAPDPIERMGIERSRQALAHADLCLIVVDGSQSPTDEDCQVAALVGERPAIVVINKADLPQSVGHASMLPDAPHVSISALTGDGQSVLERAMLDLVAGGAVASSQAPRVSNPRHASLLRQASAHLADALASARAGETEEILAIDVGEAIVCLGAITGEDASDDLLATLFARFCVGK